MLRGPHRHLRGGPHVQLLLKKAGGILDKIKFICPLHGPVRRKDLMYFTDKYDHWSKYEPEEQGVLIACASMYGNTESAAQALASALHPDKAGELDALADAIIESMAKE